MNIAHFLTPKQDVVWVPAAASVEQAIEAMRPHRHSAVPVLDERGGYVATLTEGDILWRLLRAGCEWQETLQNVPVQLVPRHNSNQPVRINAEMEALVARAIHQSFVPVVDDREVFIGIVRRQHILQDFADRGSGGARLR